MKRVFTTCVTKKTKLLMLMTVIMLCATGTNCLANTGARWELIRGKKVSQVQIPKVSGTIEEPYYVYANSVGSLDVDFESKGAKITDIKSNNKNFRVKLAHQCDSDFQIEYCARKAGNYMIVVTIQTESGEIVNKNIEVIAETCPIKKAVYENEKISASGVHYTRKKRGKFSVKMQKGYVLKKIQLGVKKKGKKIVYKKIKNKSKFSLGKLYKLYSGSAVIRITYLSSDSSKKKYFYFHIYRI